MGQANKLYKDYKTTILVLERLISILSNDYFDKYFDNYFAKRILLDLTELRNLIYNIDNKSINIIRFISDIFSSDFQDNSSEFIHLFDTEVRE